ncbi:MAG: M50 family metallopeptidase [Bdellovibrionota bacterium]
MLFRRTFFYGLFFLFFCVHSFGDPSVVNTDPDSLEFKALKSISKASGSWQSEHTQPVRYETPNPVEILAKGAILSVPAYFLGVAWHEGSHALMVILNGGTVEEFNILPHKYNGSVRFGSVIYRGEFSRAQTALITIMPKITDALILGAYSALLETDAYPSDKNVQLVLVALAAAAWVDFSRDVFATNPTEDIVEVYDLMGLTSEGSRLPFRMVHGLLALGGAIELGRGIYRLFRSEEEYRSLEIPAEVRISPKYVGVALRW